MSIIQTIRDKGAVIVIIVITLSLIGFILMDSRSGTGQLFGGVNTTTIGTVNGEKIEYDEFNSNVKQMEQQYPNSGADQRNQIMQNVWDQMVAERIVSEQFNDLGLTFTAKEMSAIMFSEDAPPQLKQAFTNKETGQYDIEQAKQWWAQTKRSKDEEQRDAIVQQVVDPMRLNSLYAKYTSLISGSLYNPTWLQNEKLNESNKIASLSFIAIPYSTVSDSAVLVTDNDIEKYIDKHENQFKQEAGRNISYVVFNANANIQDSNRIKQSLEAVKAEFAADSGNIKAFLGRNSSTMSFFDGYVSASSLQIPDKDSVTALKNGDVYGPYIDQNNYVLAKKLDTKSLPDSIKSRHILLGTNDPQTGQPLIPDSTAHQLADSIAMAIRNGANFDTLETKYSSDKVAHNDKGVMTFDLTTIQSENFAQEFADFLLNEESKTKDVVKTQFGWHYIELLEKKDFQPAYKIAYLAKEIAPSDETINNANAAATKLSGQARNKAAFDKYVSGNGLNKVSFPSPVKENDYQIGGLQDARQVIRWAFDAKEGDVSEPFLLKNQFVVATVEKIVKEGAPDLATARPLVESIVRNQKKAEVIKKKLGNVTSLETAAQAFNQQVLNTGEDSTLTFQAQIVNGIGNEPKVVGAAFNKDYQTKVSPPIAGNTGVYVIKVNSVSEKESLPPEVMAQQRSSDMSREMQAALGQSFNSLKKIATVKDHRSKFF
jgi:peptidyl-prolyl cis-trans isomerase D